MYGISKITSNNDDWIFNPEVYVITAESQESKELLCGIRVIKVGGTQPLPVEAAIGRMDSKIYDLVAQHVDKGAGELCALWNSRKVAGKGLSFLLTRMGISILNQLEIDTMFGICAELTLPLYQGVGFEIEESLGSNGTFYYPRVDLLAFALIVKDMKSLHKGDPIEREKIFELRRLLHQRILEKGPKGELYIEYDLSIPKSWVHPDENNFMKKKIYCFLFLIFQFVFVHAQTKKSDVIIYSDTHSSIVVGGSVSILEDKLNEFTFKEIVISKNFVNSNQIVPDLGISSSAFWIKAKITNSTNNERLLFELANPTIDEVEMYILLNGKVSVQKMGEYQPFHFRNYDYPSYVFDIVIPSGATADIYLKIKSKEQISVPLKLGAQMVIMNSLSEKDLLFGLYIGIMFAMFFYNIFIYITTKDPNYLYYIIYILTVCLTQSCLLGYTFQYLWSNSPWMAQHSEVFLAALVGVGAAEFAKSFLNFHQYLKSSKKVLYVFYTSYFLCILLSLLKINSGVLLDITALSVSLYLLGAAIVIARKGYRPAKFFLFAWIIFLIGVIVFALKNMGILPYNSITIYTMPAGSALEALLLSFALADRINILKKEKDLSQATTLLALRENEKLIKEQNIILEQKVEERTIELKHTNEELTNTLTNLQDTQTQLVNAEKMASLGQLTAGIAHEINNPINFVSANVKPLKLDIEDVLELVGKYDKISLTENLTEGLKEIEVFKKKIDFEYLKKEMTELLTGIEDGAKRTAEIVSGLKNFSRLDESEFKMANINEGIKSTLILLKSSLPNDLKIIVDLGNIPAIECFPGKLNQVFMNLFSNAIYAINKNKTGLKQLIIKTYELNDHIFISIEDTGIGMTPEVKAKIFEPFYTTKDVGKGTGLGMAIVFKIIESHHAKIEIESEYGIGTKILLILNKKLSQTVS